MAITYKDAGVDIDASNAAKKRIRELARETFTPGVLSDIGSFGGMFACHFAGVKEPVLVSSTDGVGTKLKVAVMKELITEADWEKFDGYTPTFQHPNLTHEELRYLLGSAYTRFYVRPSFGLNYFGLKTPNKAFSRLDAYTRRRQIKGDFAYFHAKVADR